MEGLDSLYKIIDYSISFVLIGSTRVKHACHMKLRHMAQLGNSAAGFLKLHIIWESAATIEGLVLGKKSASALLSHVHSRRLHYSNRTHPPWAIHYTQETSSYCLSGYVPGLVGWSDSALNPP